MDWVETMKDWGPFTAPLCTFMAVFGGAVIRWLLKERERVITELKNHAADASQLRDKRIEDLRSATVEYRAFADLMRADMVEFNVKSKALLQMTTRTMGN